MSGNQGNYQHQQQQYGYTQGGWNVQVQESRTSVTSTSHQSTSVATPPAQPMLQLPSLQPMLPLPNDIFQRHQQAVNQSLQHHHVVHQSRQNSFQQQQAALPAPSPGGMQQQITWQQTSQSQQGTSYAQALPAASPSCQQPQIQYAPSQAHSQPAPTIQRPQRFQQAPSVPQYHQQPGVPHGQIMCEVDDDSDEDDESDESDDEKANAARQALEQTLAAHQAASQAQMDQLLQQQARDRQAQEARERARDQQAAQQIQVMKQQQEAESRRRDNEAAQERARWEARDRELQRLESERRQQEENAARDRNARERQQWEAEQLRQADRDRKERERQEADRARQEAQDRERAGLMRQVEHERQMRMERERQLSEAAMQASKPQPQPPAFDKDALAAIIRDEMRKGLPNSEESKKLIKDVLIRHGVASKADLAGGASRMEKAISSIRPGASGEEMKQILYGAINDVAQQSYRRQQSLLEELPTAKQLPSSKRPRVQTEFIIEELPDEPEKAHRGHNRKALPYEASPAGHPAQHKPRKAPSQVTTSKSRALPAREPSSSTTPVSKSLPIAPPSTEHSLQRVKRLSAASQSPSPAAPPATKQITPPPPSSSASAKYAKSHVSVQPEDANALARVERPPQPREAPGALTTNAVASVAASSPKKSTKSHASVQPSDGNAIARIKRPQAPTEAPLSLTKVAVDELSDSTSGKSARSHASVQPSDSNAMARTQQPKASSVAPTALSLEAVAQIPGRDGSSSKSKTSKSRISVQPGEHNAVARPQRLEGLPSVPETQVADFADTALTEGAVSRVKRSGSKSKASSSKSTVSLQPSHSNAMVRPGSGRELTRPPSSAESMRAHQSGQLTPYGINDSNAGEDELDDFPDNASQVTAYFRKKESKPAASTAMRDNRTMETLRPRNDHSNAASTAGSSRLRNVSYPEPIPEEGGRALVRQRKAVAKKSSKK